MSSDASPDTPLARALKERESTQEELAELSEALEKLYISIKALKGLPPSLAKAVEAQIAPLTTQIAECEKKLPLLKRRLDELEQFLVTYRSLVAPTGLDELGGSREAQGRSGRGMGRTLFTRLAVMVLRDAQRPMQSGEFVDEFKKRGHEIRGENPTKTAWNRLWQAKRDGVLVHIPPFGYWLPNEDLPPGAEEAALAAHAERKREARGKGRNLGRPKSKRRGARKLLTVGQIETAERWLAAGKPVAQVCAELGGISEGTLWNNIPGRMKGVREKYPELAAQAAARPKPPRAYRVRRASDKKLGRPSTFVGERLEKAEAMFLRGATMRQIAEAVSVNLTTVYRHFGLDNRDEWEKRKAEYQAQQRNRR